MSMSRRARIWLIAFAAWLGVFVWEYSSFTSVAGDKVQIAKDWLFLGGAVLLFVLYPAWVAISRFGRARLQSR